MNTTTEAVEAVLDYLATESENARGAAVAESLPELLEVLGDRAPDTADDLIDVIRGLLDDPRVHIIKDDDTIVFGFSGC